jgi:IclR family KDG regulon transcriptional repressor
MDNKTFDCGLQILKLFDAEKPSLTAAEISQRLGYSLSKSYRLIRTLVQFQMLEEKFGTAHYNLGMAFIRLGQLAQQNFQLPSVSRPVMEELSRLTNETVLLTAFDGTRGVCIERVESKEPIRYSLYQPGGNLPLHAGASSKILMAYLPEQEWDRIIGFGLKKYTDHTITDPERLKAHLREIRQRGYACSDQEVDRDVRAVAAPILRVSGELLAGLSVAGPGFRMTKRRVASLGKLVIEYAKKIESKQ